MSAMDNWGGEIKEQAVPVLVIIEGLTLYLSEADVQRIFAVISGRFQKAVVFVEIMNEHNETEPTGLRHYKTTEKDFLVPKAALAPDKDAGARGRVLRFLFEAEAVSRSGEENYEILGVWHRTPGADGDSARWRNLLPCG